MSEGSPLRHLTGWAGIAGTALFVGVFLVQDAVRTDRDPITEPVSALEAGADGWVQQANFVVLGLLTLAFAYGLHRTIRPSRFGAVGPVLLAVSAVANLFAAAIPVEAAAGGTTYAPAGHVVGGTVFFATSALSLLALTPRLAKDAQWRGLAPYTAVAGALGMACFLVMGTLVIPDDAPLHDWAGLAQRAVVLLVIFPCRIALAARMLKVLR